MKTFFFIFFLINNIIQDAIIIDQDTQVKIVYSIEYQKTPIKYKMLKKMMPKETISYCSNIGHRSEINIDVSLMGKRMQSEAVTIENYNNSTKSIKLVAFMNDSIIQNEFRKLPYNSNGSEIVLGKEKKNILGYDCVYFVNENDSTRTEGYLYPQIRGPNEYKPYGLPLETTMTSKANKMIVTTKAQDIVFEPIDKKLFFLVE